MGIYRLQMNAAQETKEAASGNAECSGEGGGKKKKSLKFKRMPALALCGILLAVSSAVPVLAASTPSASNMEIDSSTVSALLDLVKQAAGLFTVFPINIFLIGSLIGLGFVIFRKAKGVAKS